LINNEEHRVLQLIINDKKLLKFFTTDKKINDDEINLLLINNGKNNLHYQVHASIIKFIIEKILKKTTSNKIKFDFYTQINNKITNLIQLPDLSDLTYGNIIELIEKIHFDYLNSEYISQKKCITKIKSKINLKDKGAVYTPNEISEKIVEKTITTCFKKTKNYDISILDFGCGTGRFFFSALKYLKKQTKKSTEEIILENLFAIDLDPIAIAILTIKSCLESDNFSDDFLKKLSSNLICENMLHVKDISKLDSTQLDYAEIFPRVFKNKGFDIIISNPPYFVLKGTGNKKGLTKFYEHQKKSIKKESNYFHQNKFYEKSIQGMLNYYRLSIECMLKISNKNGVLGIICPATLFGDTSASNLRKELLEKNQIVYLEYFPEKSKLFEQVAQATSIFILNKNKQTNKIELKNNLNDSLTNLDFKTISKIFPNLEIPFITKKEWMILEKLGKFKKINQIPKLRNRRGELDLSLLKNCITRKNTGYYLIRGIGIRENQIKTQEEFVDIEKFLRVKSIEYQKNDFKKIRITGQQISNIDADKRLKFAITEPNFILGNSCNYITVDESIDIHWILAQLNSYLLNWRFKITSSNNHINNYEIDDLPIIESKPKKFNDNLDEIQKNILVCNSFGLDLNETKQILKNHFKEIEISRNYKEMTS
jgi:adenine-specific DNA-methyltransferase